MSFFGIQSAKVSNSPYGETKLNSKIVGETLFETSSWAKISGSQQLRREAESQANVYALFS